MSRVTHSEPGLPMIQSENAFELGGVTNILISQGNVGLTGLRGVLGDSGAKVTSFIS